MDISVIIPVYNAEKYVAKAVGSALQFPEVKEVLLIEDGSPDNALEVCRQLAEKDSRVKLLQHPDKGNHGAGASRNLGLKNATCPYIAFLDADDFYLPNRFDADKRVFSENPEADGVYNALGVHFYSPEAGKQYRNYFPSELTTVTSLVKPEELFPSFISMTKGFGYFSLDCLTIRKNILEKMDKWFNPDLRLHQDTDFIIRLVYYARLFPGEIKVPVARRGVHDDNRILNVQNEHKQKSRNQVKLWDSLYQWSQNAGLPVNNVKHFWCMKTSKHIVAEPYLPSVFYFLFSFMKNRNLLTNPVFFNTIHYRFFGKGKVSFFLLRAKNKVLRVLLMQRS